MYIQNATGVFFETNLQTQGVKYIKFWTLATLTVLFCEKFVRFSWAHLVFSLKLRFLTHTKLPKNL